MHLVLLIYWEARDLLPHIDFDLQPVVAVFFHGFSAQFAESLGGIEGGLGQHSLRRFNVRVERRQVFAASGHPLLSVHSGVFLLSKLGCPSVDQPASTANRSHNLIRTEIVTTYEQLLHAYAIRAICFMEEHGVKAQQTFDGNDYQATHLVVYAGDEPIGTIRIRWFKEFAKLERMSVRQAYRTSHVLKSFTSFMFEHIARKGYDKVITHAQPKYARLWRMSFGFKPAEGKKPVYFEGHDEPYLELVKELTPPVNAIGESTDATVLFRIEGFWDAPSEFENANL